MWALSDSSKAAVSRAMLILAGYADEKPSYSNFFVNSQTWIMLDLGRNAIFLKVILFYLASSMLVLKPRCPRK